MEKNVLHQEQNMTSKEELKKFFF